MEAMYDCRCQRWHLLHFTLSSTDLWRRVAGLHANSLIIAVFLHGQAPETASVIPLTPSLTTAAHGRA
jgi:hypothetical protein